jgi:hypothetical protein
MMMDPYMAWQLNMQEVKKQQPGQLLEMFRQMKVGPCFILPNCGATSITVHPGFLNPLQWAQEKRKKQDAAVAAPPPVPTTGAPKHKKAKRGRR